MSEINIYPADMTLKVFVNNTPNIEKVVLSAIKESSFKKQLLSEEFHSKASANAKYLSLSINVSVKDKKALEDIFAFLQQIDDVVHII